MVYNAKVIYYAENRQQVRLYSYDIHREDAISEKITERRQLTNEIKENNNIKDNDNSWSEYVSRNRTVQNIFKLARANKWELFITLTFDPERVDSFDFYDCIKSAGKYLEYVRKKYCPDLKYMLVPEHHKSGRYHFHGVLANCDQLPLVDSLTKDGQKRVDVAGRQIYNLPSYYLGFSTATKVTDHLAVCTYMSKYITKDICTDTLNMKRLITSKNLERPKEVDLRLSKDQIKRLFRDNADNLLFCKTVGESDDFRISYLEYENLIEDFEFRKNFEEFGNV